MSSYILLWRATFQFAKALIVSARRSTKAFRLGNENVWLKMRRESLPTRRVELAEGRAVSRDSGERKMCAVVPHDLAKGGSGAAPLLDTPAIGARFMIRKRRRFRSLPCPTNVSPLDHQQGDFALPCIPSTRGRRAPGPTSRAWRRPSPPAPNHGGSGGTAIAFACAAAARHATIHR